MSDYESNELLRASRYLGSVALRGDLALFVGTGQPACDVIEREATRCHMPYVNHRWLGGTLTNFRMTRDSLRNWSRWKHLVEDFGERRTKTERWLLRQHRRMQRLVGLREMERLPECLVVVDPIREAGAVGEARKMGIATIGLVEVSGAPCKVDVAIPTDRGDVDSIGFIVSRLADAVLEGGWRA